MLKIGVNRKTYTFIDIYKPLAHSMVSGFLLKNPSRKDLQWLREDLMQAAFLGVVNAEKTFDAEKGIPEKAYVIKQIEIQILKEFDRINFLSSSKIVKIQKFHRDKKRFEAIMQRKVTNEEFAEFSFQSATSIDQLLMLSTPVESVSTPEEQQFLLDEKKSTEEIIANKEFRAKLKSSIDKLLTREREIVSMLFLEGLTLQEAGNRLGITKQSIHEEERHILDKLKRLMAVNDA